MSQNRYTFKIIIIGDYAVGKTSILNGYMEKKFEGDYKPTLGANIVKKEFENPEKGTITLMLWDIAGQITFQSLQRAFFEGSNGVIIVYDVHRPETFSHVSNWLVDFKKHVESDVPGVIVANKNDLEKMVSPEKGKLFSKEIGFHFIETSVLKNINIKDAFEFILDKLLYT